MDSLKYKNKSQQLMEGQIKINSLLGNEINYLYQVYLSIRLKLYLQKTQIGLYKKNETTIRTRGGLVSGRLFGV